jgi:type II pantothenate kinase
MPSELDPAAGETGRPTTRIQHAHSSSAASFTIPTRPRRTTVQSDIQDTILHPGDVRINVQGAFIVDEEQPSTPLSEDYEHDTKDIRLPNHTEVVSHIAVDVSLVRCSHALPARGTRHTRPLPFPLSGASA